MTNTEAVKSPPLSHEIRWCWDSGDPWGSALSALGGLCDVLTYLGASHLIPASVGYRPGPRGPQVGRASDFLEMLQDGLATIEDLAYWVRVLDRYSDMVPESMRY